MSDASLRVALQLLVDDRLSHFGPYDQCISIDDLEILLDGHGATVCKYCGHPNDNADSIYNADSVYWRCSLCGGTGSEENT